MKHADNNMQLVVIYKKKTVFLFIVLTKSLINLITIKSLIRCIQTRNSLTTAQSKYKSTVLKSQYKSDCLSFKYGFSRTAVNYLNVRNKSHH